MSNLPESPAPADYEDCPACAGSCVRGEKRGVRCSTCNGTARIPATAPAGDTDLDALRALCDAASPGEWYVHNPELSEVRIRERGFVIATVRTDGANDSVSAQQRANAAFILKFQPAVVRRLLDTIAELRAEIDEHSAVNMRLSQLLAGVAAALNGPGTGWSYHDLPEKAEKAILAVDIAKQQLAESERASFTKSAPITCQIDGHFVGHCSDRNVSDEAAADVNETNAVLAGHYLKLTSAPAGGSIRTPEFAHLLRNHAVSRGTDMHKPTLEAFIVYIEAYADRARTPQAAPAADTARLKWMSQRDAYVAWSKDGESCRVFVRDDEGEWAPALGWKCNWDHTYEAAIDRAMGAAPTPPPQPAPCDPLDWPLPCDVKIGAGTNKKGTSLRSLVYRAQNLHSMLMKLTPEPTAEQRAAFEALVSGGVPVQPAPDLSGSTGMRAFVDEVLGLAFEGGTADGGDIQEWGVKHGVLVAVEMKEACGESCNCARDCGEWPVTCYRKTYQGAAEPNEREAALQDLQYGNGFRRGWQSVGNEALLEAVERRIANAIKVLKSTATTEASK